ncbi:porin family protein [Dysgonomonas massiliensis]|uniref:porin family protein n=1 Tax=Dysgonomonas massiliensis TaxID=2040292 RepID=UPI000C77D95A|nr:porin family protein [Dysgonomonas massiliensis]
MKTIKLLLAATLIMVGVSLNAQDNQFTFGVKAGVNMSNMNGDVNGNKVRFGYNIGVTLDYAINQDWYILSGLQYTTKGMNGENKESLHAAYLQLPIHAGYKLEVTPATTLVFHAGPYLAYGINGDLSSKEEGVKISVSTFDFLKRFDAGLGLGVGAEFGKIALDLGWDFGLVNVLDKGEGSIRNGNAYLTVGYKF